MLSEEDFKLALRAVARKKMKLEEIEDVLSDEFQVGVPAMGAALAKYYGVPYEPFRPDRVKPQELLKNLHRDLLEATGWMPVEVFAEALVALCTEPGRVRDSEVVSRLFPLQKIAYRVTTRREFVATLNQYFGAPIVAEFTGSLRMHDDDEVGAYCGDDEAGGPTAMARTKSAIGAAPPTRPDPTDVPAAITDQVYFTVTAPKTVETSSSFVLDVWAHLEGDRGAVLARAAEEAAGGAVRAKTRGSTAIGRGRCLGIRVRVPDFGFDEEDALVWSGAAGNATFGIAVPEGVARGIHLGTATFAVEGMQISRLHFELDVGNAVGSSDERTLRERRPQTAFASYASEDLDEVLARIQGMQKLIPALDVFVDIVSIRSGENWARRLEAEIERRGAFYLFWSEAASRSEWVEREWRTALRLKGLDGIDPVPLESPKKAPPPAELRALHFNEWTLACRGRG